MMEYTGTGVMPVYEMNRSGDDGFGGQNFLWFILLIFFFGMGGNGFGFGGGNDGGMKLDFIGNGIADSTYALNNAIKDSAYSTLLGINNLSAQMAAQCCEIKTAIHAEGEATRDLIQAQIIQELRDGKQAADLALANVTQTQYILGQIGKYYPYQGVNPCNLPTSCF